MSERDIGIINKFLKKNIKDTITLGIVTLVIVAIIICVENKTVIVFSTVLALLVYYIQYQLSKKDLMKAIDKLLEYENKEL